MELAAAKLKFIEAWGKLGSEWGINRTMAQVHALLLISPEALTTEEIMENLSISRGNANMTLRDLIGWGLIEKQHKAGERKEYFFADKDVWNIARQVAKERKKRELEPVLKVLNELSAVTGNEKDPELITFKKSVADINKLAGNVDKTLETMLKAEESWFWGSVLKVFK
ncbi:MULTISPECIES: GbsR/MarR family transcriptional regulator [unclassified Pedobacter]|jgi:DNA-binding transcriptional regulator GbsR (MarR family)|uniref:GbsR/MarR family transcriptional regulator n=1 Tax=Pedobacter TaxID=84567 RepID=UPI000B4B31A5|nr:MULTISPECIES: helix-turn-helix domain-containing protein [unclassified Pedobacter]MCX2432300.1 transcriptional regulator [Pedobacter sp. GR22-10]MCX2582832.1 transcriptional regulator [Pedobacter sp. MR22-3]OWK71301.1 transcriptional regulator [Pedobacter sp. AJM]